MKYWKAHYKDALHDMDIEIVNAEGEWITKPLSFTLDNITFCGSCFNDFLLKDEAQYSEASRKFSLLKLGGSRDPNLSAASRYWYDLQRYELEVEIPVSVFRKRDGHVVKGVLFLSFRFVEFDASKFHQVNWWCDDVRVYPDDMIVREFSLSVDGMCYKCTKKTLRFEAALNDISRQIKDDYYIKCCFTCQYSDYSPYGDPGYGTMDCFCRHKDEYLKVSCKDDLFDLLDEKDHDMRQETYLCEHYCLRNKAGGYRGFVDGVMD